MARVLKPRGWFVSLMIASPQKIADCIVNGVIVSHNNRNNLAFLGHQSAILGLPFLCIEITG
jgi:hypothetical protein